MSNTRNLFVAVDVISAAIIGLVFMLWFAATSPFLPTPNLPLTEFIDSFVESTGFRLDILLIAFSSAALAASIPFLKTKATKPKSTEQLNTGKKEKARTEENVEKIEKEKRGRLHVFGIDTQPDTQTGQRLRRGIRAADRIHTLVVGFPGTGKTSCLLSLIKQHIDNNEGFMVIDSHRDLAPLVLSHIPHEKWSRVVYINPWTAFEEKYGNRITQINFLEYKDPRDKDVIARLFMDSLQKIYGRWWGPRLDMIMMHALYVLMEKDSPTLPELYMVMSDEAYRKMLLSSCKDSNVRHFWEIEYGRMPKDASISALDKVYRLVRERVVVPMFQCEKSSVNIEEAMNQGKFVIVDLPEGRITSDIANFIGSLILTRVYMGGMAREKIPEGERRAFYVYVDEAYRYITKSVAEILQSLRKYKVYMTLASQYLEQYQEDIQEAIPQTCETIICFACGEKTARVLEKFYPKQYGYRTLMTLPKYRFYVSTPFYGVRECSILETINLGRGTTDIDQVIDVSLDRYGRYVNVDELLGKVEKTSKQEMFHPWPVNPAEWNVLRTIRGAGGSLSQDELLNKLTYDPHMRILKDSWVAEALRNLSIGSANREGEWLNLKEETRTFYREYYFTYGKKEVKVEPVRERVWYIVWGDKKLQNLLDPKFKGDKAGDVQHIQAIAAMLRRYWSNGWIAEADTGESMESKADIYVTPTAVAQGDEGLKGYIDPYNWDYERSFTVEVETQPEKHWGRVKENYERNRKMGFPTVFVILNPKIEEEFKKKLEEWKATVVENVARFEPSHPEMACIDIVPIKATQEQVVADIEEKVLPNLSSGQKKKLTSLRLLLRSLKEAGWSFASKKKDGTLWITAQKKKGEETGRIDVHPLDKFGRAAVQAEQLEVEDFERRRSELKELSKIGLARKTFNGEEWLVAGASRFKLYPIDELVEEMLEEEGLTVEAEKPTEEASSKEKAEEANEKTEEKPSEEEGKPTATPPARAQEQALSTVEKPEKAPAVTEKTVEKETVTEESRMAEEEREAALTEEKTQKEIMTSNRESEILRYAEWTLRVRTIKGREYLYTRKNSKYLGLFDDEAKKIIEKHNLKVNYPRLKHVGLSRR